MPGHGAGVSRSAATIIGGMTQGLTGSMPPSSPSSGRAHHVRRHGEVAVRLLEGRRAFTTEHWKLFAWGNAIAFVVAVIAIKGFIALLSRHGFLVSAGTASWSAEPSCCSGPWGALGDGLEVVLLVGRGGCNRTRARRPRTASGACRPGNGVCPPVPCRTFITDPTAGRMSQ